MTDAEMIEKLRWHAEIEDRAGNKHESLFSCEVMWRLEELRKELAESESMVQMNDQLKTAIKIANNALYFNDSSDYKSALYDICLTCGMEEDAIGEKYIERGD
jgi:hypothetical protein